MVSLGNRISGLISGGKRAFAPQRSKSMSESELVNALNSMQNQSFNNLAEFFQYYKNDAFDFAYQELDAYTSFQLAMSSWSVYAAIKAIATPIAAAEIVPVAKDPQNPNVEEIEYLKLLLNNPNRLNTGFDFRKKLAMDLLSTGEAYVEVSYNDWHFPAAMYRIAPYDIQPKRASDGSVVFVRKSTGYIYGDDELITFFHYNPYSDYRGLSPLVPIFQKLMLDGAILRHNFDFFTNQSLKGIISLSDKISASAAADETNRMQQQIKHMKDTGDSGHLVLYGAAYQSIGATNRDMLVADVEKSVINAVIAAYGVPPGSISQIDTGNIGSGTGDFQEQLLNETLSNWGSLIVNSLSAILEFGDINDTVLAFKNLTKTDEIKKAELYKVKLESSQMTPNEVRAEEGKPPYESEYANNPWMPINHLPMSLVDNQKQVNGQNALLESMRQFDKRLGVVLDED